MSNLKDNLLDLAKTVIDTVKTGEVRASPELAEQRMQICKACPFYYKLGGVSRCKHCPCDMDNKVTFAKSVCSDKSNRRW